MKKEYVKIVSHIINLKEEFVKLKGVYNTQETIVKDAHKNIYFYKESVIL